MIIGRVPGDARPVLVLRRRESCRRMILCTMCRTSRAGGADAE